MDAADEHAPPARNTCPRLEVERLDPRQWQAYGEGRAGRPSILRPWPGECLRLQASDPRIPGRTITMGEKREQREKDDRAVSAERVVVDARLIDRVCRWPVLPEGCTAKEAARLLGVDVTTVRVWVREGKLVGRLPPGAWRGMHISYPEASLPLRVATGRRHKYPERPARKMVPEPLVRRVVQRFGGEGRREQLVRLRLRHPLPISPEHTYAHWQCPSCGRRPYILYLPAGHMARAGRTWSPWRFQCRACAGIVSEGTAWSCAGSDGLGQSILKLTCGRISGNDWRRMMKEGLP